MQTCVQPPQFSLFQVQGQHTKVNIQGQNVKNKVKIQGQDTRSKTGQKCQQQSQKCQNMSICLVQ